MDLFSLVASLTLDPKEYENELKKAERKASSARVDVDGKVQLTDEYSATLERAERAAETFDGNVDGTISATDEYSEAIDEATEKGDEFNPDASDTIEGTDEYSEAIGTAEASAEGFNPEAEGVITGVDDYTPALDGAASAAQSFDPEAEGDITANDEYSETLDTDETDAANAQLDAHGYITGDSDDFQQAIGDAEASADGFETRFTELTETLSSALTAAGIVAGISAIANAFNDAITASAGYADEVDKGAQRMSISRESYQRWRYVLGQNGASINTVTRGWMNLRNALGKAGEASDDAQAAFDTLGIDPSQFTDTEELFNVVIDALARMEEGSKRDTLVTALFGRGGTQLNAMLNTGVQGIRELQDEATELGLIMSDEDIANGVAYGDAVSAMNQAVSALRTNIVSGLFPVLTNAARMVANIIGWLNGSGREVTLDEEFSDIEHAMNAAFAGAAADETTVNGLIEKLREMSNEAGECTGDFRAWESVASRLIRLCPSLASQIDTVTHSFQEQNGTLEENARAYFESLRAQAITTALQDKADALAAKARQIGEEQANVVFAQSQQTGAVSGARTALGQYIDEQGIDLGSLAWQGDLETADYQSLYSLWEELRQEYEDNWLGSQEGLDEIEAWLQEYGRQADEAVAAQRRADEAQRQFDWAVQEYEQFSTAMQEALANLDVTSTTVDTPSASVDAGAATVNAANANFPGLRLPPINGATYAYNAKGNWDVPYDDYRTALHRGEMVLNASRAREYREDNGGFDPNELYTAVSGAVAEAVGNIQLNMDGSLVGNAVSGTVSRNIYNKANRRRYG